jgi:hypothetical protein
VSIFFRHSAPQPMSQPMRILYSEDSHATGDLFGEMESGTMLSQGCAALSLCTPENSQSAFNMPAPPAMDPKVAKQTRRQKRSRNVRRGSGSASPPELANDTSTVKKNKRPIFDMFASPLPLCQLPSTSSNAESLVGTPQATPPRFQPFLLRARDLSELSRSSSILSEDSCPTRASPMRYSAEFTELGDIGRGAFGRVVKALKKFDGATYAVKVSWHPIKGERDQEARSREARALARCDHPHILRYFSAWVEDGLVYLQTEYCAGGNALKKPVGFWTPSRVAQLLHEMASALAYLHSRGMAHMDVKGENIYLTAADSFKLGDFGLVAFVDHQRAPEFTPTPGRLWPVLSQESCASQEEGDRKYLALELLNDKSNLPAADVFALGISAYELASGRELPGGGETWQRLRQGLLDPIPDFPPELFNIIRAMMAPDASLRPAASDVVCALRSLL